MSLVVRSFSARNYRSLKSIAYPVTDLDLLVGANGIGKTNLYRALELLHAAADNRLAADLAREGGIASAFWAGPRRKSEAARIQLAVSLASPAGAAKTSYRYEVSVGIPPPVTAAFAAEPHIKEESISVVGGSRRVRLLDRVGASVMARREDGRPIQLDMDLLNSETVLARLEDPSRYPEIDLIRRSLQQWRFYHGLRTDEASPLRQPCVAVATPSLASDGSDLAALFATLAHIRQDTVDLNRIVGQAFPGARLVIPYPERMARFGMSFAEFPHRVFEARELSDGTLRFLALAGALLAYRLPPFIALNEPEASLHPDLMEPLAELVVAAARRTQLWLVTHSSRLADAVVARGVGKVRRVLKRDGATVIEGLKSWGAFDSEEEEDEP